MPPSLPAPQRRRQQGPLAAGQGGHPSLRARVQSAAAACWRAAAPRLGQHRPRHPLSSPRHNASPRVQRHCPCRLFRRRHGRGHHVHYRRCFHPPPRPPLSTLASRLWGGPAGGTDHAPGDRRRHEDARRQANGQTNGNTHHADTGGGSRPCFSTPRRRRVLLPRRAWLCRSARGRCRGSRRRRRQERRQRCPVRLHDARVVHPRSGAAVANAAFTAATGSAAAANAVRQVPHGGRDRAAAAAPPPHPTPPPRPP